MAETCKLCLLERPLQSSHAIPDSIFCRLFRSDSGKAIHISSDEDISYTSDSLARPLLCSDCEKHVNINCEKYAMALLRGSYGKPVTSDYGILFKDVDTRKFLMYLLSIFWRCAISDHNLYNNAVMPFSFFLNKTDDAIRHAILTMKPLPTRTISFKIERVRDKTGEINQKVLKGFILLPTFHHDKNGRLIVQFCIEGFLVSVIMPGVNFCERTQYCPINIKSNTVSAKYIDLPDSPAIFESMLIAYHKNKTGQTKIGIRGV